MKAVSWAAAFPALTVLCSVAPARAADDVANWLSAYDVSRDALGRSSADSMPLGNGDIGLNVWTEPSGDICFYLSKTDAWAEENRGPHALLKLGRVRLTLSPNPLAAGPVRQTLHLHEGFIDITAGAGDLKTTVRLWVDANHPVVRIDATSARPLSVTATYEPLRTKPVQQVSPDVKVPDPQGRVIWYHHNAKAADPELKDFTFGAALEGDQFVQAGTTAIQSARAATQQSIRVHALTLHPASPQEWRQRLDETIKATNTIAPNIAWAEHARWWADFWNRSWIFVTGDDAATTVTRGAVLQRYITACAGRGAQPIKFNGSIFNVEHEAFVDFGKDPATGKPPVRSTDADYRRWGGQYWFQNTRPMYWPRLMAGDFDMMRPLFQMYQDMVPKNTALVKQFYHHDGVYFAETAPWYGGLKRLTNDEGKFTDHYFTPILELTTMMLDYYDYTQDEAFLKDTALPIARGGLTFFQQHFGRDANGKLLLDPDNSIETYWRVSNPSPDIAGLRYVTQRLLELPERLTTPQDRADWQKLREILPPLPRGQKKGNEVLLPYTGPQTAKIGNSENPELYAIYPFRLFGLGHPELQLAKHTYEVRMHPKVGCWAQDPIFAAYLGLADVAKKNVEQIFRRQDPYMSFPGFWEAANDYDPDEDNGGNGENVLQKMLMQCEGRRILLLPAWPKQWSARFRLHAPYRTVLTGRVEQGKLVELDVEPADRTKDLVIAAPDASR